MVRILKPLVVRILRDLVDLEDRRDGVTEVNGIHNAALQGRIGFCTRDRGLGCAQRADDGGMRPTARANLQAFDVLKLANCLGGR